MPIYAYAYGYAISDFLTLEGLSEHYAVGYFCLRKPSLVGTSKRTAETCRVKSERMHGGWTRMIFREVVEAHVDYNQLISRL